MSNKKELEVIICIGIPASGKSTWAKDFVKNNDTYIRTSRDDFRLLLKNQQVCDHKVEEMITELQDVLIRKALAKRKNVIIDNTNVKLKYINHFINLVKNHANINFKIFEETVEVCIERDRMRNYPVGDKVIMKMNTDLTLLKSSFDFKNIQKNKIRTNIQPDFFNDLPKAIIFDVDGTLAHMGDRSPFDWKKVDIDHYNPIVGELTSYYKSLGRLVIILTGRDGSCKELTENWLKSNNVEYDLIFTRRIDDNRSDYLIKKEIYETQIKDRYNILAVFDDRLSVINMWSNLGLFVFNVNNGQGEF